jgi:hypothetical protein
MKKTFIFIIVVIAALLMLTYGRSEGADKPVAYDLGNGYTAVQSEIFDELVKNDKLVDLYKQELEYNKKKWEELKELTAKKDEIQEERILVLKDTIGLQDQIIEHKDSIITDAKVLYEMKADEVKKYKAKSIWDKALVLGLGAWAISEIDNSSTQIGLGLLTATFVLK